MVGTEDEGPAPPSAKELAKVASSLPPSASGNVTPPASGLSNSSNPAVAPSTPVLVPTPPSPPPGTYRGPEPPYTKMSFADYLAQNNIFYRDNGVPYVKGANVNTEQVQKQVSILQEKYAGIPTGNEGGVINSVDKALQTAKENFGLTYVSGGGGGEKTGGASARDIYVGTALAEYEKGYVASSQKDIGNPPLQNLGTLLGKVGLQLNLQTGVITDPLMAGIIAHDIEAAKRVGLPGGGYGGEAGPQTPQSAGRNYGWRALNYGQGLVPQQFNGETIYVSQAQVVADILARQNNKEYGGQQEFLVGNIGTENVTGSFAALYPKQQEGKKQTLPQANVSSLNETPLVSVGGHIVLGSLEYTPTKEAVESANIARQNVNNVLLQKNLNERANAGIDALVQQDKQLHDFFANVNKAGSKVDTIDIFGEFQNNESVFPAHENPNGPLSAGAAKATPTTLRLLESVPVSKGEKGFAEVLAKYSGNTNLVSPSGKVNWTSQNKEPSKNETPLSVTLVARSSNPNEPNQQDKGLGITNLYGLAGNKQNPNPIEKAMGKTETDFINAAVNTLTVSGLSLYSLSSFALNQLGVQAAERVALVTGQKPITKTPLESISQKALSDLPPSVDYLKGKPSGEGLPYDVGFATGDVMAILATGGLSTITQTGRLAARGAVSLANRARLELAFGGIKGMVYNKNYGLDVIPEAEATIVPRGAISYEAGGLRTASTYKSLNPMRKSLPSDIFARDYAEIPTGSATITPPPSPASVVGEQSILKGQQEKLLEPVSTKTQPNQPVSLDPFANNRPLMKSIGPNKIGSSGSPATVDYSVLAPTGETPTQELAKGVSPLSYGESVMNYYKSFTTEGSTGFASSNTPTTITSKSISGPVLPSGPSPLDLMIENQVYGVNLLKGGEEKNMAFKGGHIKNYYPAYRGAVNPAFEQSELLENPPNEFQKEKDKFQKLGIKSFLPESKTGTQSKGYYLTARGQADLLKQKFRPIVNLPEKNIEYQDYRFRTFLENTAKQSASKSEFGFTVQGKKPEINLSEKNIEYQTFKNKLYAEKIAKENKFGFTVQGKKPEINLSEKNIEYQDYRFRTFLENTAKQSASKSEFGFTIKQKPTGNLVKEDIFYSPTQNIRQFFERLESTNYNYGNNPNLRQGITKEVIPYRTKNKTVINTDKVLGIETEAPTIGEAKDRIETILKGGQARTSREAKYVKPSFDQERYLQLTKRELELNQRMVKANEDVYLKRITKPEFNLLERSTREQLQKTKSEIEKLENLKPQKKNARVEENFRSFTSTSYIKNIKPDLSNYHNIGQNQILEPPQVKPPPEPPKPKQRQDYGIPNPLGPEAISGEESTPRDILKPAIKTPLYIPLHVQKNKSISSVDQTISQTLGQTSKTSYDTLSKQSSLVSQVLGSEQTSKQITKPDQTFKQDQKFKQTSRQIEQPRFDVPLSLRQPQIQAQLELPILPPEFPPQRPPPPPPPFITTDEPKRKRHPENKKKKEDNANFLGSVSEIDISLNFNREDIKYGDKTIRKLTAKDVLRSGQLRRESMKNVNSKKFKKLL